MLLLIAHWDSFRFPVSARVIDLTIKGHQNILAREMLCNFKLPVWCRQVIVEAGQECELRPEVIQDYDSRYNYSVRQFDQRIGFCILAVNFSAAKNVTERS